MKTDRPRAGCTTPTLTRSYYQNTCCYTFSYCDPNANGNVSWNFGDGTSATTAEEQTIRHCYCPGTYSLSYTFAGTTYNGASTINIPGQCNSYNFIYDYEIISAVGCTGEGDPSNCSVSCDQVTVSLTDNSTNDAGFPVLNRLWEAIVYNGNMPLYSLFDSGTTAIFSFPDWHGGISIDVVQTLIDCSGNYENISRIKVACGDQLATPFSRGIDFFAKQVGGVLSIMSSEIPTGVYTFECYDLMGRRLGQGTIRQSEETFPILEPSSQILLLVIKDAQGNLKQNFKIVNQ